MIWSITIPPSLLKWHYLTLNAMYIPAWQNNILSHFTQIPGCYHHYRRWN